MRGSCVRDLKKNKTALSFAYYCISSRFWPLSLPSSLITASVVVSLVVVVVAVLKKKN